MSARYTSPDLSRRLRDAGLEQRVVPGSDMTRYWRGDQLSDSEAIACGWDRIARALRLDEVLEELHAASLTVHWSSTSTGAFVSAIPSMLFHGATNMAEHANTVEAAGLVLAQLLEARRRR